MSQLPMFGSSNMNNYPWNHLITKIPPSVATKLNIGGCSYVLLGLLSIGLDVGAIVNGMISFQCFYGTWSTILIVDLVTCFVTLCLTIFNMITITSGRRPQYASAVTPTILYAPQMQPANVLYANPSAVIVQ
ncbi:unnamed protein product [Rotaria socialis]|uniref:Uncharacterized protein n=1 Tax=Rotaria socialis TaxID=392032 RepID=A0A820T1J0_9BILA|nr:unnamed protein product [Rotaria socialis]CAF4444015.1 unnamed protein product [Rotaria socialis]CAF4458731.1 unnamed protein product [Rotaria socialis]CAF4657455.1 unnamed protein product [Rotaria socialis]CAF4667797.1 unnamed protein product [Rotaria socialis]